MQSQRLGALWRSQSKASKVGLMALGLVSATSLAYLLGGGGGISFQANLVGGSPKPFDGTVYPVQETLNWVGLSSTEFSSFKSGEFTYDAAKAAGKVIPIPRYDTAILANDPGSLGWQGADRDKRTTLLTYVTAYMGAYTSGSKAAIEQAGSHVGIDIRAARGTPIYAIANGRVTRAGETASNGKFVVIEHPNVPSLENPGTTTTYHSGYLHLDSLVVSEGQIVDKGAQIGTVGMTGTATTYHLHFQIDRDEAPFKPYWPFTFAEASKAGMDFFTGVNQGLGREKGNQFSVNPKQWIHQHMNGSSIAPTTITPTTPTPTPPAPSEPITTEQPGTPPVTTVPATPPATPAVARLRLSHDTTATAGTPLTVTIQSEDATGTLTGAGLTESIILQVEGGLGEVTPNVLTQADMQNGQTTVRFIAGTSGTMAIVARSGTLSATGPVITVMPEVPTAPAAPATPPTSTVTPQESIVFADVTAELPEARAISYLQSRSIIDGYPDGTFKPNQAINRAEVTKVILGGSSIDPLPSVTRTSFRDVFTDDWFASWVERARELSIVEGNPDGTFTPATTVNVASALKILLLTNGIDVSNVVVISNPYVDVPAGEWFAIYFQYAKDKNLIDADASGRVYPASGMTRAQVAEMMYRLIRLKETGAERYGPELDL